ncbi:MAG TPA: DEAD/DEAH box helicase [Candidatus Omnitrophota bacterium]|nr:DEAD/DEAH box helicase [Candidatus Omnitrophota bacterium]
MTIQFSDLGLIEPIQKAVAAEGYTTPTPIQAQAIPHLLEGRDVLGIAQTGTGKTAAFALPILNRLASNPRRPDRKSARVLILTPTRELAVQIGEGFATYGANLKIRRHVIFGGVGQHPQVQALMSGLDVIVATPGRLLDLIQQGHCHLDSVEVFVLDEADRMLDMGFIHDVKKIASRLPKQRQTLLFSATMPEAIADLASGLLNQPVSVEVTPVSSTAERIDQRVLFVSREDKRNLLLDVLGDKGVSRAIVFTRTKHGANKIAEILQKGGVKADAIHGNKSQNARQKALNDFRDGRIRALVATDIAARGIDVDGVTHVINFDLPNEPESYVHRIGRTARAGAEGIALSFCDAEEVAYLRAIERTTKLAVPMDESHAFHAEGIAKIYQTKGRAAPRPSKPQQSRPHQGARPHGHSAAAKHAGGAKPKAAQGQASGARQGGGNGNGGQQARRRSA